MSNCGNFLWQSAYMKKTPAKPQPAPALPYFHIPLPEYSLLAPTNFTGVKQESISSASINSGFLTTLLEAGDVKAAFVGHDHVNDFCGDVHGKIKTQNPNPLFYLNLLWLSTFLCVPASFGVYCECKNISIVIEVLLSSHFLYFSQSPHVFFSTSDQFMVNLWL